MAAVDAVGPAHGWAECSDDLSSIAQWAEGRKQELAQWATDLRAVQSPPLVTRLLVEGPTPNAGGAEHAVIVPMVESLRRAAMERLDAEATAARAEASATVAVAMQAATALVLSVGDELRSMRRATVGALRVSASLPEHPLAAMPAAGQWQELEALRPTGLPDADAEVFGPEVDLRDAAQVYDLFWREAASDRPVVERLRRWVQRPQP
jgi:hypothetical protein